MVEADPHVLHIHELFKDIGVDRTLALDTHLHGVGLASHGLFLLLLEHVGHLLLDQTLELLLPHLDSLKFFVDFHLNFVLQQLLEQLERLLVLVFVRRAALRLRPLLLLLLLLRLLLHRLLPLFLVLFVSLLSLRLQLLILLFF